jgi:uncharacterized membrane protein HdeD (DUF308 family)
MQMMRVLARNWWALALRGVIAVLFGVAALAYPGMALAFLIALFTGTRAPAPVNGVRLVAGGRFETGQVGRGAGECAAPRWARNAMPARRT